MVCLATNPNLPLRALPTPLLTWQIISVHTGLYRCFQVVSATHAIKTVTHNICILQLYFDTLRDRENVGRRASRSRTACIDCSVSKSNKTNNIRTRKNLETSHHCSFDSLRMVLGAKQTLTNCYVSILISTVPVCLLNFYHNRFEFSLS